MKFLVMMILEMCRSVWSAYSDDASSCRGGNDMFDTYKKEAQSYFMTVLEEAASTLLTPVKLRLMGF